MRRIAFLLGLALAAHVGVSAAHAQVHYDEIVVGLRGDAPPFSYLSPGGNAGDIADYQGFVVRICQEILRNVTQSEPFQGAKITVVSVTAASRFPQLNEHKVDMLCGPDSVTSERLDVYRVSTPVFLTGVSYAYLDGDSALFPRGAYCGAVVGVVKGTTAEESGIGRLAQQGAFLRFNYAVDQALRLHATKKADAFGEIRSNNDCQSGFTKDPIQTFETHDEAVEALCAGEVLYYVADFDIMSYHLAQRPGCEASIERYTVSREIYALFFGAPPGSEASGIAAFKSDILYARFSSTLMRLMQGHPNILERAFEETFPGKQKSEDLKNFFASFVVNVE